MKRAFNFNAGPAALPLSVLQKAQEQFVDYNGAGMSIMEMSHRSAAYEAVNNETEALVRRLLQVPDNYKILFMTGGASTQFAMLPMNFLAADKQAAYVHTGAWASKAISEAKMIGQTVVAASAEADQYMKMPSLDHLALDANTAYLHVTSNETIGGTQMKKFPSIGNIPLIADMSSDILSRPLQVEQFGMIYAGAQKNLGPSGVTLVIIRDDLVAASSKDIPTMFRYSTHAKSNSLYNTPPSYSVYMMKLVLEWIEEMGGVSKLEAYNEQKTDLIYNTIDNSDGFYRGCADPESRSRMNITFRLATEQLEKQFVQESELAGFVGLKGHRDVGGLRASTYNAVPLASCEALAQFMKDFQQRNG